jgi:hypothetical protein
MSALLPIHRHCRFIIRSNGLLVGARTGFQPIVDHATFAEAQRILQDRTINKSDGELLDSLRALLASKGRLSLSVIKESSDTPSPSTYTHRFGSLRRAYELIQDGRPAQFGPIDLRRGTQSLHCCTPAQASSRPADREA